MINFTAEQLGPIAREATRLLKAMAHPSRLLICCQLREGEMSVGEIESTLGIRQPNLSRELGRLREDGIVTTRRESRVVFYRLHDDRACELIEAVCGVMLRPEERSAQREVPASAAGAGQGLRGQASRSAAGVGSSGSGAGSPAARREFTAGAGNAAGARTEDVLRQAGGYGVFARTGTSREKS